MPQKKTFLHLFTEGGPMVALAAAVALFIAVIAPASAQWGWFGGPSQSQRGWFGRDFFAPFQQQQQPKRVEDFSRAPPPAKRDTERNVLVLGDAMADWLA